MTDAFAPLGIRMQGRAVTIVGAGAVAARKAKKLASAGAQISVIAPRYSPSKEHWLALGATILEKPYAGLDEVPRPFLVIAATDDSSVNAQVAHDARALGALVVRADDPEDSDLAFPATLRRGKLTVSYATDGASPTLARRLREQAEIQFDESYALLTDVLERLRQIGRFSALAPKAQREFLNWQRISDVRLAIARSGADAAFDALVSELDALVTEIGTDPLAPEVRHTASLLEGADPLAPEPHHTASPLEGLEPQTSEARQASSTPQLAASRSARGLFIVHTGDGKGKTSAAMNLVYRHLAHGKSACVVQFIKNPNDFEYGDVMMLERLRALGLPVTVTMLGAGYTWRTGNSEACKQLASRGWEQAAAALVDPRIDLVVCDELHIALRHGHLELGPVLQTIVSRRLESHVVTTGRNAPDELLGLADLVTDFVAVKHPFAQGVRAQAGIEY